MDEKTKGIVTWERATQRSTIDYALANREMHKIFLEMTIDEEREVLDLSDHNLIEIKINITRNKTNSITRQVSADHYYFSTKTEHLETFRAEMESTLTTNEITGMKQLNDVMETVAEFTLKRKYKKRPIVDKNNKQPKEKPWFSEEIKKGIQKRKERNRKWRNAKSEDKEQLKGEYYEQKKYVQKLIKEAILTYEKKITNEIRQSKDNGKTLWKNINKLKGMDLENKVDMIYDEEGSKLEPEEERRQMRNFWKNIYGKHENTIDEKWNVDERETYKQKFLEVNQPQVHKHQNIPPEVKEHMDLIFNTDEILIYETNLREHLDMEYMLETQIKPMAEVLINPEKIK